MILKNFELRNKSMPHMLLERQSDVISLILGIFTKIINISGIVSLLHLRGIKDYALIILVSYPSPVGPPHRNHIRPGTQKTIP